jgi:CoA:oxalate CoA-transferase
MDNQIRRAGEMLSDMGAEIIKVEPRRGDMGRNSTAGAANAAKPGPYFVAHDRGKHSVTVDITKPRGREIILRFAERVDAAVNIMRPTVMERLGLGYADLCAVNPKIVYASASTYGPLGDKSALPGFDIIGQAAGGIMTKTGHDGGPHSTAGAAIADQVGAIYLCSGVLAGLLQAARTGRGVQVDSSLYGAQIGLQSWEITNEAMLGHVSGRGGSGHPLISPTSSWGTYCTSDGAVVLGGINGERFIRLCGALGVPELAERYPTDGERAANIGPRERLHHATGARGTGHRGHRRVAAAIRPAAHCATGSGSRVGGLDGALPRGVGVFVGGDLRAARERSHLGVVALCGGGLTRIARQPADSGGEPWPRQAADES